jgi:hypothetical protein
MNLAPHYVPFIRSAPPKVIRELGLGVLLALALGTGTAGARGTETAPPLEGGAHCGISVKPHHALDAVAKGGMPVNVTCDAPARVQVIFELNRPSPQARALTRRFPHDNPGICRSRDVAVGTGTTSCARSSCGTARGSPAITGARR